MDKERYTVITRDKNSNNFEKLRFHPNSLDFMTDEESDGNLVCYFL